MIIVEPIAPSGVALTIAELPRLVIFAATAEDALALASPPPRDRVTERAPGKSCQRLRHGQGHGNSDRSGPSRLCSRPDALFTYPVLAIRRFRCAPRPAPPFGCAIAALPGVARSPARGRARVMLVMTALYAAMAHAAVPSRAKSIVTETPRSLRNPTTQADRPIPNVGAITPGDIKGVLTAAALESSSACGPQFRNAAAV